MARIVRTRSRTRSASRRRNLRTRGAVLVNPRPRRSTKRRVSTRRRNPVRTRSTRRSAAPKRRRSTARRRNPVRRHAMRRSRARAPKVVYRYRKNARSRKARRRNPARRQNPGMLKKIPLIGGLLSGMFSFVPSSLVGGASIFPAIQASKLASRFAPNLPASATFGLIGLAMGAVVSMMPARIFTMIGLDRKTVATAVASASAGVGAYKALMKMDVPVVIEAEAAEMAGASFAGVAQGFAGAIGAGTPSYAGVSYAPAQPAYAGAQGLARM